ncbi:MAG: nitrilase-related carbon-nitrogen hydrolase [Acidobacteriota bacterium]
MRIAVLQTDIAWEDAAANHRTLEPEIARAAGAGARLVVLPEMFACGFSMNVERVAESSDGPSATFLRAQARAHDVWLAGTLPERGDDGIERGDDRPANVLHLVAPDGTVHRYAKLHPFSHAGEDRSYRAGDAVITVEVDGVRITPFVCYDLRFANVFWQAAADTDAYLVVANWPRARAEHWRTLLRARAIENQAYVIAANRVGRDGNGLDYDGDSAVIDPRGRALATAAAAPAMLLADVDPAAVTRVRTELPFLADRRADVPHRAAAAEAPVAEPAVPQLASARS